MLDTTLGACSRLARAHVKIAICARNGGAYLAEYSLEHIAIDCCGLGCLESSSSNRDSRDKWKSDEKKIGTKEMSPIVAAHVTLHVLDGDTPGDLAEIKFQSFVRKGRAAFIRFGSAAFHKV